MKILAKNLPFYLPSSFLLRSKLKHNSCKKLKQAASQGHENAVEKKVQLEAKNDDFVSWKAVSWIIRWKWLKFFESTSTWRNDAGLGKKFADGGCLCIYRVSWLWNYKPKTRKESLEIQCKLKVYLSNSTSNWRNGRSKSSERSQTWFLTQKTSFYTPDGPRRNKK